MIKVSEKMLNEFIEIMEDYNEFLFGTKKDIKKQLEICLNSQGYYSGTNIRIFYNKDTKNFSIESRNFGW